ncbi:MAG: hypothetical protein RLZZ383_1505 [Pseudomonadota bacterium]|jgi:hypothetical protein
MRLRDVAVRIGWAFGLTSVIGSASAQCPASEPIRGTLNCQGSVNATIDPTASTLTGYCAISSQPNPEDVYQFTCTTTGTVYVGIQNLSCDLDLYVLTSTCAPGTCAGSSTAGGTTADAISFTCTAGQTYYVVVEQYSGSCATPSYTLGWDLRNGVPCGEQCTNGYDDDADGLSDCNDSDCATNAACCDDDADGFLEAGACGGNDCNDLNNAVKPTAPEVCNSVDDNCDGGVDVNAIDARTWYRDADADSYGVNTTTRTQCSQPVGYVVANGDCDDSRPLVKPGGTETCNGLDDDCDGVVDDSPPAATLWYLDRDADGVGDSATSVRACNRPLGYAAAGGDCDDLDPGDFPGALELCNGDDEDCDGSVDEAAVDAGAWYADDDRDGYGDPTVPASLGCQAPSGFVGNNTDCAPADASAFPGALETCDGVDEDCDGSVDDNALGAPLWFYDEDGDGFGVSGVTDVYACEAPLGFVADRRDCDGEDAAVFPGAEERCNGLDDNCDTTIDEATAVDATTWFPDQDRDGFGFGGFSLEACTAPVGWVALGTDCNDATPVSFPGNPEVCDRIDNDCNGFVDESAADAPIWYEDADADGYGDPRAVLTGACTVPAGYADNSADCGPADAGVRPGAVERCNAVDDDCDGVADEDAPGAPTWFVDADGDGAGASGPLDVVACTGPAGFVAVQGDCNDARPESRPGAPESCNTFDDDCDGLTDEPEAVDARSWYPDADRDGFGADGFTSFGCSGPTGWVNAGGDCDDFAREAFPGAAERCDGLDNDCDGETDEDAVVTGTVWYADADGDGAGDPNVTYPFCDPPPGYVENGADCADADATRSPYLSEQPYDGVDQDCDGADVDDVDGDGVRGRPVGGGDCNDQDPLVGPFAAESPDGRDQDCDGLVDEGTALRDDDGDGATEAAGDCDDASPAVRAGLPEVCDGLDNDCDGRVDEETSCFDDDGDGVSEEQGDCNDRDRSVGPAAVEVAGNGVDDDCDGSLYAEGEDDDRDGVTVDGGDCDDADPSRAPGVDEAPNGIDDDCDDAVDEGTSLGDDDGDGLSEADGDCHDDDDAVRPDVDEVANGVDDDCDGDVDEGTPLFDDDGDGITESGGDCDDADASRSPIAEERVDGVDNDCDGVVDEETDDRDLDGFTAAGGDCADADGFTYPGAIESCDSVDNDCDGAVDEGCEDAPADTGTTPPGPGAGGSGTCGCSGAPVRAWLGSLSALAVLMVRRRTAPRP